MYLLGTRGTATNPETFERQVSNNPSVIGLLKAGQKLKVKELIEKSHPNLGSALYAYATVESGPFEGRVVDITFISRRDLRNRRVLERDPDILTVVE